MTESIAKKFDEWAASGDGDRMEEAHGDVGEQVLSSLDVAPGEKVLDLGCGTGWATRALAKAAPGVQAIGVDASPGMIARADELHSFTIRARYDLGGFEKLDFPDEHFTRAFSMEALYYTTDLDATLSELLRVLKPGSPIDVVIDYYTDNPGTAGWPKQMGLELVTKSEAEWKAAFEAAGFTDVTTQRVVDRRGPGDPADFRPKEGCEDWETYVSVHENGSLWIRARKPA